MEFIKTKIGKNRIIGTHKLFKNCSLKNKQGQKTKFRNNKGKY